MKIAVGVTGSIAAYKAADLVSKLRQKGDEIHVVMTKAATELVGPATFRALSGNPVLIELFPPGEAIPHIRLADWLDILLICPATANIIGKIAAGIADDLLSSLVIATAAPVIIAPAMNEKMYTSKVVQQNIKVLQDRGYRIIEPETGFLACGYQGQGRLAKVETIISKIRL